MIPVEFEEEVKIQELIKQLLNLKCLTLYREFEWATQFVVDKNPGLILSLHHSTKSAWFILLLADGYSYRESKIISVEEGLGLTSREAQKELLFFLDILRDASFVLNNRKN